jgi:hypothetical protein
MSTDADVERRLTALEAAVADIQQRLASQLPRPSPDWVERFAASFKDEQAFAEVIAYGRAIRKADRPATVALRRSIP